MQKLGRKMTMTRAVVSSFNDSAVWYPHERLGGEHLQSRMRSDFLSKSSGIGLSIYGISVKIGRNEQIRQRRLS